MPTGNTQYNIMGATTTAGDLDYFRLVVKDLDTITWYKGISGDMFESFIWDLTNTNAELHSLLGNVNFTDTDWYCLVGSNYVPKPAPNNDNEIRIYCQKGENLDDMNEWLKGILLEMNLSDPGSNNGVESLYLRIEALQQRNCWFWRKNGKPPIRVADATLHVYYDTEMYDCWAESPGQLLTDLSGNGNDAQQQGSIGGNQNLKLFDPFNRVNNIGNDAGAGYNYAQINNQINIAEDNWLLIQYTGQRTSNTTAAVPRYIWDARNGSGIYCQTNPAGTIGWRVGTQFMGISGTGDLATRSRHIWSGLIGGNGYASQFCVTYDGSQTTANEFILLATLASTPTGYNQIGTDFTIGAHYQNFNQLHPGWIGTFRIYEFEEDFFDQFSDKTLIQKVLHHHDELRIDESF